MHPLASVTGTTSHRLLVASVLRITSSSACVQVPEGSDDLNSHVVL